MGQLGGRDATRSGVDAAAPPWQRGRQRRERPLSIDPRVWRMAFARAVNTMGLSLVMTFLGIYIVKPRGYPASVYGVIALAANLAQSMANAWAASLSDRIGRRPLITTALFVPSGFVALLGTQILLDAPLRTLGATMVVSATLRGCFEPVAYALVADVMREDQRVTAFGIQRVGTNLGWALGPALGLLRRLGIRTTPPWSSFLARFGFALVGLGSGFMGRAPAILIVNRRRGGVR